MCMTLIGLVVVLVFVLRMFGTRYLYGQVTSVIVACNINIIYRYERAHAMSNRHNATLPPISKSASSNQQNNQPNSQSNVRYCSLIASATTTNIGRSQLSISPWRIPARILFDWITTVAVCVCVCVWALHNRKPSTWKLATAHQMYAWESFVCCLQPNLSI